MTDALEMRGVTKRFGPVVANDHVDFAVEKGEIHALLGENGAGKSTLMNVLSGLYRPDEGTIFLDGKPVRFGGPADSIAHGIGMVHQHFMLVPTLTVAENVMLGREYRRGPFLDQRTAVGSIAEVSARFGLELDPRALIADLSVGQQQRVEIVKVLHRGADILILDEPTAVLTPHETEDLLRTMRELAERGKSLVFITHKLREALAVADNITVLRDGRVVGATTPAKATVESLAEMMVGRPVLFHVPKGPAKPGSAELRVRDLAVLGDRKLLAVDGMSFEVRAGEIVGLAGVEGNGQAELVEALTGLRRTVRGSIIVGDKDLSGKSPHAFLNNGVAHIPSDRHKFGLVLTQPVSDNLVLTSYDRPPFAAGLLRMFAAIRRYAERVIDAFDIRPDAPDLPAGSLSGGNQQKTVVARELSRSIRLLLAAQPTRGVDVGSTEFIHRKIVEARDSGVAVLLVSTELDEILSLSDRIVVIFRGRLLAEVPAGVAARDLGLLMAGAVPAFST